MDPAMIPVIDVQNDNFKELWPSMVLAMKTSSFIAVDTELSGLGHRKALMAESIEDRYKAILNAARSRSILSLGIACYKKMDGKADDTYLVQVFNLTLLCSEEYVIEPMSVQFLVQHGFDFNKQYAQGVPYYKGNDKGGPPHGTDIRFLFVEMLRARRPLVLHNGLIDMVFLYQCFYAHLPDKLGTFTADLSEMFPAGIYDTKYATEYELRYPASYLEYAYKKCKLDNSRSVEAGGAGSEGERVLLEFCNYSGKLSSYVDYRQCLAGGGQEESLTVCQRYSAYGWCPNGSQCALSHDTDLIIQQDEKSEKSKEDKRKKRKRKRKQKDGRQAEEGPAGTGADISEGAPVNKMSYMELEAKEPKPDQNQNPAPGATAPDPDPETRCLPGTKPAAGAVGAPPDKERHSDADDMKMKTDAVDGVGNGAPAEPPPPAAPDAAAAAAKTEATKKKLEGGTHRAGFDAFMTGYIFAHASALAEGGVEGSAAAEGGGKGAAARPSWLPNCLNKVYLSGKSVPLNIVKSSFSRSSKAHTHKMEMVWGKGPPAAQHD